MRGWPMYVDTRDSAPSYDGFNFGYIGIAIANAAREAALRGHHAIAEQMVEPVFEALYDGFLTDDPGMKKLDKDGLVVYVPDGRSGREEAPAQDRHPAGLLPRVAPGIQPRPPRRKGRHRCPAGLLRHRLDSSRRQVGSQRNLTGRRQRAAEELRAPECLLVEVRNVEAAPDWLVHEGQVPRQRRIQLGQVAVPRLHRLRPSRVIQGSLGGHRSCPHTRSGSSTTSREWAYEEDVEEFKHFDAHDVQKIIRTFLNRVVYDYNAPGGARFAL